MMLAELALHAVLLVATPSEQPPDWVAEAKKSVVLVQGVNGQPATGFIVGSNGRDVYVVTARHAVIKEGPAGAVTGKDIALKLDPEVCGTDLKAEVSNDDRDADCAIVHAPVSGCKDGIGRLQSLHHSSLNAANAQSGIHLLAFVREATNNVGPPHELVLWKWNALGLELQQPTAEEWSGAPLFTGDGEIVGVLRSSQSGNGFATDFAVAVMKSPAFESLPFNLAGKISELQIKGYPSGSRLKMDQKPWEIQLAESPQGIALPPGKVHLTVSATNYDSVEGEAMILDPGIASRCVRLVRPRDRLVAKSVLPFTALTVVLGIATGISAKLTDDAKSSFTAMPSRPGYDDANSDVTRTRLLLIGTVASGALAFTALAINHFSFSPRLTSTMWDCPPWR
jgi:hypothetical protein